MNSHGDGGDDDGYGGGGGYGVPVWMVQQWSGSQPLFAAAAHVRPSH